MKTKKVLITILLAIIAIMLLQTQVKAVETGGGEGKLSAYINSYYDYFLTASNKVLSKAELSDTANAGEEIIACIEGEYTGTISSIKEDGSLIKISNLIADEIIFYSSKVWIDGKNEINSLSYYGGYDRTEEHFYFDSAVIQLARESNGSLKGKWVAVFVPDLDVFMGLSAFEAVRYEYEGELFVGEEMIEEAISKGLRNVMCNLGKEDSNEEFSQIITWLELGLESVTFQDEERVVVPAHFLSKLKLLKNKKIETDPGGLRFSFISDHITNTDNDLNFKYSKFYPEDLGLNEYRD